MKKIDGFLLGDMLLSYFLDEAGCVSMTIIPAGMRDRLSEKKYHPEPLVQIHARGDHFANGYGNGHTLAGTSASEALKFVRQEREDSTVTTTVADGNGRTVHHQVTWAEGLQAVTVRSLV